MTTASAILSAALLISFLPATLLLFAYGFNLYYLMGVALFSRRRPTETPLTEFPHITVQLPLYNERYVSRRIIDAAAQFDYPSNKLTIQVLDDSTDETRQIVAESVAYWRARGVDVQHICRTDRHGYKAGALAYGLALTDSEYIAIFDADFVPPPHFLKALLPSLLADPKAAFVQARWEHLNSADSWLTRVQAISVDSHFSIEQDGRFHSGFPFNFNGTAGIWRRAAIADAQGWQARTLTEDLDLSYRAWLKGWHGIYRNQVSAPAELPPTMTAYKRQQARWAQGSLECARLLIPKVWRSAAPLGSKLQATVHLLSYMVSPTMAILVVAYTLASLLLPREVWLNSPIMQYANAIGPFTFAPTLYLFLSQVLLKRGWRAFPNVLLLQVVSSGLAMTILRAAIKALIGQRGEFLRTPKWGGSALSANQYHVRADIGAAIDFMWGVVCLLTAFLAAQRGHAFFVVYGLLLCVGSWAVAFSTVFPDLKIAAAKAPITAPSVK
jgi:cellulose synthase/poly-beta-1,6-N-acetylglucosamine synthase-like glycosyltransferase